MMNQLIKNASLQLLMATGDIKVDKSASFQTLIKRSISIVLSQ